MRPGTIVTNSGAGKWRKGDVIQKQASLLIECKTVMAEKQSVSIKHEWLVKNKEEAFLNRLDNNCLCINFGPNTNNYYVNKFTSVNICDFIAYTEGKLYLLECKSHSGASLPFSVISQYDKRIQRYSDLNTGCPKVIICGQCTPTEKSVEYYPDEFDSDSIDKAFHLNRKLKEFCKAQKILYCPAPEVIEFCEDGCHYSRQGHELFAQNVATFIKSL